MSRRSRIAVALVVATGALAAPGFVATPVASANVCDKIPSLPLIPNPIKVGCKVVAGAPGAITHPVKTIGTIISAPFKFAADTVMQGVTSWVADGAAWLVGEAGKLIDETTTPNLTAPWFTGQYRSMAAIAAVFALPLLLAAVLQGIMRRDGALIVRAAFVQLPAAFLLTAGAVVVVALLLGLTDQMCGQVSQSIGSNAKSFFSAVGKSLTSLGSSTGTGPVVPLFAVFLGGLIAAVGAFFVWIELLIRSAAIYVAVLFLPFTFVAMIWSHTARWCRRLVELLFAIIFAKFVIVAILALAAAGLLSAASGEGFQGVLAGTALMLLAAFSPFALLRLIPMVEGAAHASGRSGAGAQTLGPVAGPAAVMRRVMDGNWGGASGLRAAPAGAGAGGAAGFAMAGGAGAMAGGVRAAAQRATATAEAAGTANGASTPQTSRTQNGRGQDAAEVAGRYPASGGGGEAARPPAQPGREPKPSTASPSAGRTSGDSPAAAVASRDTHTAPRPVEPPRDPARERRSQNADPANRRDGRGR